MRELPIKNISQQYIHKTEVRDSQPDMPLEANFICEQVTKTNQQNQQTGKEQDFLNKEFFFEFPYQVNRDNGKQANSHFGGKYIVHHHFQ